MWNYVHLLGKDLFVSPRAELGAPLEEERAQPMEAAKNIKTAMFTDYPKGKQITAIISGCRNTMSANLPFHLDVTFIRVEHTLTITGIQNQAVHVRCLLFPIRERSKVFVALIAAAKAYVGSMYLAHADEHVIPSPPPIIFPNNAN